MSDLKNKALNLELISDEVNYDGAIPVNLMSCKHDLIGKEYCQFVGLFSLRSRYVQHRQPNEVVGSIECLLVDPYCLQEQNDSCYTVRHNEAYIGVSQINVPKLWSQGNNNWKLLINQGIQPNKLSTTLSVRKI